MTAGADCVKGADILSSVALALLLTTALSIAGFLATSVQGFLLAARLTEASPLARALVGQHVRWAIPAVLLSLFSQSMVIFYFIGTGRLVKDEIAGYPDPERNSILAVLRRLKRQTSPPATFSLLSAVGVFVLGGAVHTRALPSWTHLAASVAAVLLHVWAFGAEWKAFAENNRLMDDPRRYAEKALGAGRRKPSLGMDSQI
jgi:hypothetical protein